MRIRRYMDLLREFRGVRHHYSEPDDIYVDFNLEGTGNFPGFMRLGEAIAQHQYRAVFVDLVGQSSFPNDSFRNRAYAAIEYSIQQLPVEVIDVSCDPAGVLLEKLKQYSGSDRWSPSIRDYMADGYHDLTCFFPGLAAGILNAVFFQEFFRGKDLGEVVRRHVYLLRRDNPYASGQTPWLPDTIWYAFWEDIQKEGQEADAKRRASGETLYRIEPGDKGLFLEERLWCGVPRPIESMPAAEDRLSKFGFTRVVEGQIVSYQREMPPFTLFADPRPEGKIGIGVYRLEPPKGKRGKPKWASMYKTITVLDRWWKTDLAAKFEAFLAKNLPPATEEKSRRYRLKRELLPSDLPRT